MPVGANYSFSEKEDKVVVKIPLKGCSPSKVDIFVTTTTLKVNFSPYLIDVVLAGHVDALKHKAKVKEGVLIVTLLKNDIGKTWGNLEAQITDKNELNAAKEAARAQNDTLQTELAVERKDRKIDDEKHALRKQMALEEREKSLLEGLKADEKEAAEKKIYEEFAELERRNAAAAAKSQPTSASPKPTAAAADTREMDAFLANDDIDSEEEDDNDEAEAQAEAEAIAVPVIAEDFNDADIKYVPPPRSSGYSADTRVEINYTPRIFPTPMRESKATEEEDWVAKNRQHLKKNAMLNKNASKGKGVDVSESDPTWLKGKGDDFFRMGDFKSAINAYSAAIDVDEDMTSCYSNRSACYMKLGMHDSCVHDCKKAILQIRCDPALDGPGSEIAPVANQVNKLYIRRGAANCLRGNFGEAISDYLQVVFVLESLQEMNITTGSFEPESLKQDITTMRVLSECEQLKKTADKEFAEGEVSAALKVYSEALALLPVHVGCLSNRSACKIALGDVQGCIDDCTAALKLLEMKPGNNDEAKTSVGGVNMLTSILPAVGSEKRVAWVLKTIVRRGAAYAKLNKLDHAVDDYTLAASLKPSDEKLKKDLNNIRNYREGMLQQTSKKNEVENL
eukprot:GSChrysophyteH1.ASY1.ANO1.3058.1 assembled CDS